MANRIFSTFVADLASIMPVVNNQSSVSSELLATYEGNPNQFDQLVEIIAEGQGVDPDSDGFRLFVFTWKEGWTEWALTAKAFRGWLDSTQYSYKYTTPERLAELFIKHLVQQRICHDHSQDFRPGPRRDK